MALLEGQGLSKRFGGVCALEEVRFTIEAGSIVGLIGPNGAGKTTLFNIVAGTFPPSTGTVKFKNETITGLSPSRICRHGIARTFQVTRPFGEMSCLENVAVAVVNRHPGCPREQWETLARESLAAVNLEHLKDTAAKHLNVVQKKRLEIARSIATEPELLMLDEVLGGLNTQEIQEAIHFIRQ
ncbi:MAG: ATP-binding cassette domain-containing protein, partial [Desulfatitalea sp.]|nr:ATP-binding cassette domain-containing protein [Desulfatitalea sp.]